MPITLITLILMPGAAIMPIKFNPTKTIQAAGVLLRTSPHQRMSRLRLLKLLYIADRENIRLTGQPITGDRVVAMRHGPVLSHTYDSIKGTGPIQAEWDHYFTSEWLDVVLKEPTPNDDLCNHEIELLQKIAAERQDKEDYDLAVETHGFAEWRQPGDTSAPITFEEILDALGKPRQMLQEAAERAAVDGLFERFRS